MYSRRNSLLSILSWVFPIATGLIATRLIVKSLGSRDYGLYAVILGFVGYSFSFGVAKVLTKYIAEFRASGENEKIGQFVSATFWFSLAIALLGTVIVAISARYIVSDILLLPVEQREIGEVGLYLACAAIVVTMLSQIFQYILQGLKRFRSFLLLTNISGIVLNAGNVALALLGYGIGTLLTWNVIALSIMAVAFGFDAVRHLPEFSLRLDLRSKVWPAVLRYGSSIVLFQIFGNLLFAFERAWVVRKFGAEAATYYLIPMTLAIYMAGMVGSSVLVLFPAVNELLTDRIRLIALYEKATKMMIALIVFLATGLIFGGRPLLEVWVGADIATRSYPILVIHTLTFALNASIMIVWQLAEGFRFPGYNTLTSLIWMLIAIPVMVLSADSWNIEGIAFGRFLGVLFTLPLIVVVEKRCLGGLRWHFWASTMWRVMTASIAMAISVTLAFKFFTYSWWSNAIIFFLGGLAFALTLWTLGYLTADERKMIRGFIFRRAS